MKELVLKAEEVKALLNFAEEIPTKFGEPLKAFITAIGKRQQESLESSSLGEVETEDIVKS